MSPTERRNARREARKTAASSINTAPDRKTRRSPLRRALIAASALAVFFAMTLVAPKAARADGGTPEIDPGSMAGAMTLLAGGVLALTDRKRQS
jgi:hypothetical protein